MENDRKGRVRHNDCIAAGYSSPARWASSPLRVHGNAFFSFSLPSPFHSFLCVLLRSYDLRVRPKSIFPSVKNCICVAGSGKSVAPCRRSRLPCMSLCGVASSALSAACLPRQRRPIHPASEGGRERSDVNPKSVQPFPIDNGLPGTPAALPIDCETSTARDGKSGRKGNSYVPIPPSGRLLPLQLVCLQDLKTKIFARGVFNYKNIPPRLNSLR